jgi:hypothetical protein
MPLQRLQHGFDGAWRDYRPRPVMHQNEVGGVRLQGKQPGTHGILPLSAARDDGQMRQAGKRRADQAGITHRLQQIDMGKQRLGRMPHYGLAMQQHGLFGRIAAEAGAAAGGD